MKDTDESLPRGPRLRVFGREVPIPRSRAARIAIGVFLILCGFLGFLPVLGFWMVPAGLLVLSYDSARVRRWRRRFEVWWGNRYRGRGRDRQRG